MRSIEITDKGTIEHADGILRLSWRKGQTIEMEDAQGAVDAIDELGQGNSLPMLILLEGVNFTRESRKVFPSKGSVSRIALFGSSPVDYAIALFVLRISPLPCPVSYFTSSRKAMDWLRTATDNPASSPSQNAKRTLNGDHGLPIDDTPQNSGCCAHRLNSPASNR